MAFRAAEAAKSGYEEVEAYLIPRGPNVSEEERARSKAELLRIVDEFGPVIDSYPSWHPLVAKHDPHHPCTTPHPECGYQGLDHTRYFANAFITCPYGEGFKEVLASANKIKHPAAFISARVLDVTLYNPMATPVLVTCEWNRDLADDGTIPLSIAAPLILQAEVPNWTWAQVGESWERMRHYLMGSPQGSRSSLFVNQETGQGIKKLWNTVIETGMFGPIR